MIIENKNIIVIGNGTSVLKYRLGELIDSFEEVVRFNDFQIEGYEEYIGSKTTIWARSNSTRTKPRDYTRFKQVIVASPEWNFKNTEKYVNGKDNAICVPQDQALELQNELNLPGLRGFDGSRKARGWPSTGVLVLNYLIKLHGVVYIHGFDCFKKEDGFSRHYYNGKEKMRPTIVHKENVEREWINKKVEQGQLRYLVNE